VHLILQ
jgi:hypothetical protein